MIVKLLTEHHLEFLSSKGGCRGSSESTLVRMSNCWKSRALAHNYKTSSNKLTQTSHHNYFENSSPRIDKNALFGYSEH